MDISVIKFFPIYAQQCSAMIYRVLDSAPSGSFTPTSLQGNKEFYSVEKLVERESAKWRTFLAISDKNNVCGTVSLCLNKNWLYGMWIDPNAQGMGIGKKLFNTLVNEAKQSGISTLGVFSVMPALGFYRQMGFQAVHHHSSEEYGELEEMTLKLGDHSG